MISVILCTYNRDKYIYNVLKSVADNDYPRDQYEIVLVNNNSTDTTESECQRFMADYPDIRFRYCVEKSQGLSYARNCGIRNAERNTSSPTPGSSPSTPMPWPPEGPSCPFTRPKNPRG